LAPSAAGAASAAELAGRLRAPDWKTRYAALQRLVPSLETLPLLAGLLGDDNASVRRLAVVYIGDIREPEALPHLFRALHDPSPAVRRTAGDTLSDIGDPAAIPAMIEALRDSNKLVRWRAARFLYEVGDDTAAPALRELAEDEPEFEIRMQANLALERIEGGHAAEGSVWQQMTRRNQG
jgi:HEAT repeat protein